MIPIADIMFALLIMIRITCKLENKFTLFSFSQCIVSLISLTCLECQYFCVDCCWYFTPQPQLGSVVLFLFPTEVCWIWVYDLSRACIGKTTAASCMIYGLGYNKFDWMFAWTTVAAVTANFSWKDRIEAELGAQLGLVMRRVVRASTYWTLDPQH